MSQVPEVFLQAFLDDFERYHRLRSEVLERLGPDGYKQSQEVKDAHAALGKRIALAQRYVARAGGIASSVDLFFNDSRADRTRDALLTAIGAYEHGLVEHQTGSMERQRDQKFGILEAPSLLEGDLLESVGALGVALLYLDVDHFKLVNTKYTERVVDKTILPQFQRLVADVTQGHGRAYAEGGDEVVVLLSNFSCSMATAFATDLLARVRTTAFKVQEQEEHLSISVGLACTDAELEAGALADRANVAKKHAKEQGRDRASIWTPTECRPCQAVPGILATVVAEPEGPAPLLEAPKAPAGPTRSAEPEAHQHKLDAQLRSLSPVEKGVLRRYLEKKSKTQYLVLSDGVTASLEHAGLIYRASTVSRAGMSFAYNLQPWAWGYLQDHPEVLEGAVEPERDEDDVW